MHCTDKFEGVHVLGKLSHVPTLIPDHVLILIKVGHSELILWTHLERWNETRICRNIRMTPKT